MTSYGQIDGTQPILHGSQQRHDAQNHEDGLLELHPAPAYQAAWTGFGFSVSGSGFGCAHAGLSLGLGCQMWAWHLWA